MAEVSAEERAHYDTVARMMARAAAEVDRHIIAEYRLAVENGENPPPPMLSAERDAIAQREAAARRAALPPYLGPIRRFAIVDEMYCGFPDDVRPDEVEAFDRENRRPWDFDRP